MKRIFKKLSLNFLFFIFAAVILLSGCGKVNKEVIFQNVPFAKFASGCYDGEISLAEARKHGNFGIGTINGLDGEMIVLKGAFSQIKADGKVYRLKSNEKTPFVTLTFFDIDKTFKLSDELNYQALQIDLDKKLNSKNMIYAIKITGKFPYLKVRSVPKQVKPFKDLTEVLKNQEIFILHNVEGVMVGFKFPEYLQGATTAGYHFHFLSKDKLKGGHVLDCSVETCQVEVDETSVFDLE